MYWKVAFDSKLNSKAIICVTEGHFNMSREFITNQENIISYAPKHKEKKICLGNTKKPKGHFNMSREFIANEENIILQICEVSTCLNVF